MRNFNFGFKVAILFFVSGIIGIYISKVRNVSFEFSEIMFFWSVIFFLAGLFECWAVYHVSKRDKNNKE